MTTYAYSMFTADIKEWIAIAAIILSIGNHLNYLRAIFAGHAKPHFYSWLIWTITQGTAATAEGSSRGQRRGGAAGICGLAGSVGRL